MRNINNKKRKPNKIEIYLKLDICWCEESFCFITFKKKLSRKTFAVVEKTPEYFFKVVFDTTN